MLRMRPHQSCRVVDQHKDVAVVVVVVAVFDPGDGQSLGDENGKRSWKNKKDEEGNQKEDQS